MSTKTSDDPKAFTGPAEAFELPSGKKACLAVTPKGKHFLKAARLAGAEDPMAIGMALASVVCKVDGHRVPFEEIVEMDLADALKLQEKAMGKLSVSSLSRILRDLD